MFCRNFHTLNTHYIIEILLAKHNVYSICNWKGIRIGNYFCLLQIKNIFRGIRNLAKFIWPINDCSKDKIDYRKPKNFGEKKKEPFISIRKNKIIAIRPLFID